MLARCLLYRLMMMASELQPKSDLALRNDVEAELQWEPAVHAEHVGVTVKDGVVTLTGHVDSYAEKFGAERAAKRVIGVIALANELDVKPVARRQTDEDLAVACRNALLADVQVPANRLRLVVHQGWVRLEGLVITEADRLAAERAVRAVRGIAGMTSDLRVEDPRR